MEQFTQFNVEKQAALDTLNKLGNILGELDSMGVDVSSDLKKVASAIEAIDSDVLRIALLGAFSDGKTSVIAAWLGVKSRLIVYALFKQFGLFCLPVF